MFAYTFYNHPPVKIPALEPNLYLSFVYQSAAHRDPENLREWRESVAGWQKLGAKLVVREGWGNHYYFDLPFLHDRADHRQPGGGASARLRGGVWRRQQELRDGRAELLGDHAHDVGSRGAMPRR